MLDPIIRLKELVERITYKEGWTFEVELDLLMIVVVCDDSSTGLPVVVQHNFAIPNIHAPDEYLRRYVFERIMAVERHEAMEFFKIDGDAIYYPDHEGSAAYITREKNA